MIELLVTVSIVGILLATAIPSMQETIRRNRIDAEAERVFISITRTRNNALTTNSPSFLCRSNDAQTTLTGGISCRTDGGLDALDWNTELIVYTLIPALDDRAPNNRLANQRIQVIAGGGGADDVRRQMVQNVSEPTNSNIVSTANRNDFVLRFDSNGALRNQSPFRIGICDNGTDPDRYGKLIEINASGQIRMFAVDENNTARNCEPNTAT